MSCYTSQFPRSTSRPDRRSPSTNPTLHSAHPPAHRDHLQKSVPIVLQKQERSPTAVVEAVPPCFALVHETPQTAIDSVRDTAPPWFVHSPCAKRPPRVHRYPHAKV